MRDPISSCVRWSVGCGYCYNSFTISWIGTKIGVRVDIDKGYHLVKGQGHWVKVQGQIHDLLKKNFLAVDHE